MISFHPEILEQVRFPTPLHERVLREAIARFAPDPRVKAMALTNSLARNVADEESDLDYAVFVAEEDIPAYRKIASDLRFAEPKLEVHMSATQLVFTPQAMDLNDLDTFEIRIGNFLAHAKLLFDRDGSWSAARGTYLPYYDEALATQRLARFKELALYQITQGELAVRRGLVFEGAQRVLQGLQLFFAALFIKRRVYPVDYLKRVELQLTELLRAKEIVDEAKAVLRLDAREPATITTSLTALRELVVHRL